MRSKSRKPQPPSVTLALLATRGYQQEMLEESLQRNIIVALDTGSGKTHIAILRIKHECERQQSKLSWFIAPTVSLCRQQRLVIATALPVSVGLISGADEPDQWKDARLWRTVLSTHRIVVSTPQILLDALRHGYVDLGRDISLLVFDEAHHAVDNHPCNQIMKEFYFRIAPQGANTDNASERIRPNVLGLTASPVFGGNIAAAFRVLESNLDCTIRAPRLHREELGEFVHRPTLKHVVYAPPDYYSRPYSPNLASLERIIETLNIEDDPFVKSLRRQLARLLPGSERTRVDALLSKTLLKSSTFTHKGLADLARTASEICQDVGPWASDWYIQKVVQQVISQADPLREFFNTWKGNEKAYLLQILDRISITPVSYEPTAIVEGTSAKVLALVLCLEAEKADVEANNEAYSGLVFVTRRDTVLALTEVLSHHPRTKGHFNVGSLLGVSENSYRKAFIDITRKFVAQLHEETLEDFKHGEKNLLISTAVAEEGIDIQACGSVIRWNVPPNMVSWAQSRGRARRKRSTYTVMFEQGGVHNADIAKWEALEREMMDLYNSEERSTMTLDEEADLMIPEEEDDDWVFRVESTGATLTLHSALPHLYHFCATIPNSSPNPYAPIFELYPPDLPEGWHSFENRLAHVPPPYPGPWSSTVTLPRCLPPSLQTFTTGKEMYSTKVSAHQHVAFTAYLALYKNGLLNEHLLPLTDDMRLELDDEVKALLKDVEKRESMAGVSCQLDPWTAPEPSDVWFASELLIDGLPSLLMFTVSKPISVAKEDGPTLYRSDGDTIGVEWRIREDFVPTNLVIDQARQYTRRLFWFLSANRIKWEEQDFAYLFLPTQAGEGDDQWDTRRKWLANRNTDSGRSHADNIFANAGAFGAHFSYPTDLSLISSRTKQGQFVRWKFDAVTPEEEEVLRAAYAKVPDLEIAPPFLVIRPASKRRDLLQPLPPPPPTPLLVKPEFLVIPSLSTATLLSNLDIEYALVLPSILRFLSLKLTTHSLRTRLFSDAPLDTISNDLLATAMSAPVSQERNNYQRLETLGDTVLKFIVGVQLLAEYPQWHEGYLTKRKDHSVANVRLAKAGLSVDVHRWIVRDRLVVRKWKPVYRTPPEVVVVVEPPSQEPVPRKKSKAKQDLSTKVLADVVEALIGAAYLQGSFDLGIACAKIFDLGIPWQKLPMRIQTMLGRIEHADAKQIPAQIRDVERMLGYEFEHKLLLVEALTHPSHYQALYTSSYERMELLGDSVLDIIVTDMLYHAPGKKYSPGHMHLRKSAVVNSHFLAYICLGYSVSIDVAMPRLRERGSVDLVAGNQSVYLWQCLLHSSPRILDDQRNSFNRYKRSHTEIENLLKTDSIFPWAALTRLQSPKWLSDMVESVIGAVYLDSGGNFDVVRQLLWRMGILPVLERIINDDVDVLHPVSRLWLWASKHEKKVEHKFEKEKGKVACVILVDGVEEMRVAELHTGRASQEEVKFTASEEVIKKLKLSTDFQKKKKRDKSDVNDGQ